tara:strand:+ start:490 stop:1164 length:675 start_codon:yes stop_codon:yes gene_type:complete
MALTARIDLSGCIKVEKGCTQLLFSDTTGFLVTVCNDEYNELGYGLVGGIALDDVTSAQLNVYYPNITTPVTFDFIIASHVITECLFTDLNGTVTDITTLLASTAFPLFDFDITLSTYLITLPELSDGIIKWDYTISGVSGGLSFSYTTSDEALVTCTADCCIENSYVELDLGCGCLDDKLKKLITSEVFLQGAKYAMNVGQDSKAEGFLTKAQETCESNCTDC